MEPYFVYSHCRLVGYDGYVVFKNLWADILGSLWLHQSLFCCNVMYCVIIYVASNVWMSVVYASMLCPYMYVEGGWWMFDASPLFILIEYVYFGLCKWLCQSLYGLQ
jgi:hypothetical protein